MTGTSITVPNSTRITDTITSGATVARRGTRSWARTTGSASSGPPWDWPSCANWTQRRNKARLREAFATCPEVTFREIPDPAGDSATFLSVFAPDEDTARAWTIALADAGVPGCFYWYDNNWHYPRKWDHLKEMRTPGKSPLTLLDPPPDLSTWDIERSDRVMSRTISMLVKLSWIDEELDDIRNRIRTALEG